MKLSHLLLFLVFVAPLASALDTHSEAVKNKSNDCKWPALSIEKNFEGGAFAHCQQLSATEYQLDIHPENTPINPSPWYGFKVSPSANTDANTDVNIKIDYSEFSHKHRYWPKASVDGKQWHPLPENSVVVSNDKQSVWLRLGKINKPVWIAAQPILSNADYDEWLKQIGKGNDSISIKSVGLSVGKRPINQISFIEDTSNPYFVILGRQHPPELTGAFALQAFVDRISQPDELATAFRRKFNVLVYPNINPDGVALGYWRHNLNGVDLNRDWKHFKQPETKAVIQAIEQQVASSKLLTMIDFHSTNKDVFYTQRDSDYGKFANFTREWFEQINHEQSAIAFTREASRRPENTTSKTYFFNTYGIPATTYELNDTSTPANVKIAGTVSAETFMKWWLANTN